MDTLQFVKRLKKFTPPKGTIQYSPQGKNGHAYTSFFFRTLFISIEDLKLGGIEI